MCRSYRIFAAVLLFALPFLWSCDHREDVEPSITTSAQTTFVVDASGGEINLAFNATHEWTAKPINDRADEWFSISPSSGKKGDNTVKMTVRPNDTYDERNATLRITASTATLDVVVTQKQKDALTASASKNEIGADGGSFSVEVKSNVSFNFEITKGQGWIHNTGTKALSTSTLEFSVDKNEDVEKREGEITINGAGGLKETIHVYQSGATPTLVLTQNQYTVSDKGETIQVEVKSNVEVSVSIDSNAKSWIEEVSSKATSTSTYRFKISPNESYDSRTGGITFRNASTNLSETVTITQLQKDALVVGSGSVSIGAEGGNFEIVLGHNIDYSYDILSNWIKPASTKAFTEETVTFTAEANTSFNVRVGAIQFKGKDADGNELKANVIISQAGETRTIILGAKEKTISSKGETFDVEIQSNIDVVVSIDNKAVEWIEEVSSKTMSTSSYRFKVSENTSHDPRTGGITFSDPDSDVSETLTITQLQKDAIILSDGEVKMAVEGGTFNIVVGHNIDYSVSIGVDWIKDVTTKAFSEETLSFSVDENPNAQERTGIITFTGKDADGKSIKVDFKVIQNGQAPFIKVSTTTIDVASCGESFSLEFESNCEITATPDKDWITYSGIENNLLLFKAKENTNRNDRSGHITLSTPDQTVTVVVEVNQKGTANGLGYEKLGVYSFGGEDWKFNVGKDEVNITQKESALVFTLFNPTDNVFFQIGGMDLEPEVGGQMDAVVIQNMSYSVDATFSTILTVELVDGAFARLSSDRGFSLVVKTR